MNETAATYRSRSPRQSADERRDAIVDKAMAEFAMAGLAGAKVDKIAEAAGVSQPYVYQLFGTKKDLFLAVVRRAFGRTRLTFEEAVRDHVRGTLPDCNSALHAMGIAYQQLLLDKTLLLVQLQAYAACSDPDVQAAVRTEFHALHVYVVEASGASTDEIHHFFADGMLLNVAAAIDLSDEPSTWTLEQLGGAH